MQYDLIDKVVRRKREALEARRRRLLERVVAYLDDHHDQFGVKRAVLFGSVTRPYRFRSDSDIDVAVEGVPREKFFSLMAALTAELGREVDLHELETLRFRERVEKEGIPWKKTS